ncbi:MAG TPA: exodeoxyribonuclease VII small subunit [Polyangiaceae bacterium]
MPTAKSAPSLESPVTPGSQNQSFEVALERLGTVVERLESGELGLEESLRLFEEGVRLARAAQERLDSAEKRVEELVQRDEDGNPVSRELEPE